jgi:hypothetical protein
MRPKETGRQEREKVTFESRSGGSSPSSTSRLTPQGSGTILIPRCRRWRFRDRRGPEETLSETDRPQLRVIVFARFRTVDRRPQNFYEVVT